MGEPRPLMKKMLKLTVRARSHDQHEGKSLAESLFELYRKHDIGGATVIQGIRGYGVRGTARFDVLGLSANLPIIIETVGEYQKVEELLGEVKKIVGSNGLITLEEVNAF